jgi:hypothetical protein
MKEGKKAVQSFFRIFGYELPVESSDSKDGGGRVKVGEQRWDVMWHCSLIRRVEQPEVLIVVHPVVALVVWIGAAVDAAVWVFSEPYLYPSCFSCRSSDIVVFVQRNRLRHWSLYLPAVLLHGEDASMKGKPAQVVSFILLLNEVNFNLSRLSVLPSDSQSQKRSFFVL